MEKINYKILKKYKEFSILEIKSTLDICTYALSYKNDIIKFSFNSDVIEELYNKYCDKYDTDYITDNFDRNLFFKHMVYDISDNIIIQEYDKNMECSIDVINNKNEILCNLYTGELSNCIEFMETLDLHCKEEY